ncbi:MAG: hypothetical protein WCX81_04570 [Monoglobales bacterium]
MNKEELLNCFDAITPTDEQKDKMLAEILKHKEKVFKPAKPFKYQVAFAAVLALGIVISARPQLFLLDKQKDVPRYEVAQKAPESVSPSEPPAQTEAEIPAESTTTVLNKKAPESSFVGNNESDLSDIVASTAAESTQEEALGVADAAENSDMFVMATLVPDEDLSMAASFRMAGRELFYDEVLNDETYGNLFPKKIIEGFDFASAIAFDNSLEADFTGENGYIHIRIYNKSDAEPSPLIITPDELLEYEQADTISFSISCGDFIVYYEIDGKNITGIYDMVVSTDFFNK